MAFNDRHVAKLMIGQHVQQRQPVRRNRRLELFGGRRDDTGPDGGELHEKAKRSKHSRMLIPGVAEHHDFAANYAISPAIRTMAARLRSTSDSVVAQLETLMRMATC